MTKRIWCLFWYAFLAVTVLLLANEVAPLIISSFEKILKTESSLSNKTLVLVVNSTFVLMSLVAVFFIFASSHPFNWKGILKPLTEKEKEEEKERAIKHPIWTFFFY